MSKSKGVKGGNINNIANIDPVLTETRNALITIMNQRIYSATELKHYVTNLSKLLADCTSRNCWTDIAKLIEFEIHLIAELNGKKKDVGTEMERKEIKRLIVGYINDYIREVKENGSADYDLYLNEIFVYKRLDWKTNFDKYWNEAEKLFGKTHPQFWMDAAKFIFSKTEKEDHSPQSADTPFRVMQGYMLTYEEMDKVRGYYRNGIKNHPLYVPLYREWIQSEIVFANKLVDRKVANFITKPKFQEDINIIKGMLRLAVELAYQNLTDERVAVLKEIWEKFTDYFSKPIKVDVARKLRCLETGGVVPNNSLDSFDMEPFKAKFEKDEGISAASLREAFDKLWKSLNLKGKLTKSIANWPNWIKELKVLVEIFLKAKLIEDTYECLAIFEIFKEKKMLSIEFFELWLQVSNFAVENHKTLTFWKRKKGQRITLSSLFEISKMAYKMFSGNNNLTINYQFFNLVIKENLTLLAENTDLELTCQVLALKSLFDAINQNKNKISEAERIVYLKNIFHTLMINDDNMCNYKWPYFLFFCRFTLRFTGLDDEFQAFLLEFYKNKYNKKGSQVARTFIYEDTDLEEYRGPKIFTKMADLIAEDLLVLDFPSVTIYDALEVYDTYVDDFGRCSVDAWLDYLKFVKKHNGLLVRFHVDESNWAESKYTSIKEAACAQIHPDLLEILKKKIHDIENLDIEIAKTVQRIKIDKLEDDNDARSMFWD